MISALKRLGLPNDIAKLIWNRYLNKADRFTVLLTRIGDQKLLFPAQLLIPIEYMDDLAFEGHLQLLQWVCGHNLSVKKNTTSVCLKASENGHLEVLKWARKNGFTWNEWVCAYAALHGHLEVLQWVRNEQTHAGNICPWDENTCQYAALGGHLKILQWLRDEEIHGKKVCPWDKYTCIDAGRNQHFEIQQWAHENGCPCKHQLN